MRKTTLENEEYYHIYNRGVDKRKVFMTKSDYYRFLEGMRVFNKEEPSGGLRKNKSYHGRTVVKDDEEPLVEIIAYCLNPNHYHFILKQRIDNGISEFMKRLGGGYTWYFNKKNHRSGSLFQGKFKSVHIGSNDQLVHLSAYINKNYYIHKYDKKISVQYLKKEKWVFSSEMEYTKKGQQELCKKDIILRQFKNKKDYKSFIDKKTKYFQMKKESKELY